MLYDIILSEPSTFFYCYLVTCDPYCDSVTVMSYQTLTPVSRIEDRRKEKKRKIKSQEKSKET